MRNIVGLFLLMSTFCLGSDFDFASHYKALTLLPPVIAIILAFITRNVIISLFVGIFTGTFLVGLVNNSIWGSIFYGFNSIVAKVIASMADSWNAGIILQVLTIGGLIALVTKMGGARAVAESLAKRAKTPASAQIITWVMGLFIFFDDYANALIVGPIMKPIADKMKISRERLSFIIDATAAPIAGIAVISTWVGYEISLIKDGYEAIGMNVSAYNIFIETIPYRFYNILMLVFVFASSYFLRDFGPMLKAERRARSTGQVSPTASSQKAVEDELILPKEGIKLSIWNAIIPIGVLIIGSFIGFYINGLSSLSGDILANVQNSPYSFYAIRETFGAADASIVLFEAALFASVIALIMGVSQKIFNVTEALDTWVSGMKPLIITGVILLLAWSLSSVIKELGTSKYLVSMLSDSLPKFLLPAIIFILSSIISFSTGTSFGTMGILMPLTIPLANSIALYNGLSGNDLHSYIVIAVSSVLTGAILGDHCSPISDTTILSSMGADCDHIAHVRTQLFYAIFVGGVSIFFGYIPVALGLSIWFVLPVSILITVLAVRFIGKRVDVIETQANPQSI